MSVTVTKADGVTVVTMTTKTRGSWPPVCELLAALCYNPVCCSVSQKLSRMRLSQTVLGVIQIMVGLINIALGAIRLSQGGGDLLWLGVPYWLGGVFIAVGIMCVLAGKFHSPCLVGISVLVNLAGVALALTGIVFYSIDLPHTEWSYWWYYDCGDEWGDDSDRYGHRRYDYDWVTPSVEETLRNKFKEKVKQQYKERCNSIKHIVTLLMIALDSVLLILVVVQLCLTISSAVLSLKALCRKTNLEEQGDVRVDYQPLVEDPQLEEVTATKPAALPHTAPGVPGVESYKPELEDITTTTTAAA